MKLLFTIILLIFLSPIDIAGQENNRGKKITLRKQARLLMKGQIKQLREGVLLVRLHSKEQSIAALERRGKPGLAEKIKNRQDHYNREIISSFKSNFTFCPVYFFFSNYSGNIASGQFDENIFLNEQLQTDSTIRLTQNRYLTAEFGNIERDTSQYFSHRYANSGDKGFEYESAYYGEPDMRFNALRIMSDRLVQLNRPFPFYVRTFDTLPIRRKIPKVVKRMNKKLFRCYNKHYS